jgi:hypothetical protein
VEISGIAFRLVLCLSDAAIDGHFAKPSVSIGPSKVWVLGYRDSKAFMRPIKSYGALIMNYGFYDNNANISDGHIKSALSST